MKKFTFAIPFMEFPILEMGGGGDGNKKKQFLLWNMNARMNSKNIIWQFQLII